MNRAAKRLAAYLDECLSRAKRGGRHWLRLPLAEFMRATGYTERTARAAWATVRETYESRLVRRGRSSVSMVALQGTLSPCNPQYKGGIPSELEKRNNTEHAPQPARTKSKFFRADQGTKQRDPLRRLAAWFAWRLGRCHWDACRVRFNPGFAQAYAAKAFALAIVGMPIGKLSVETIGKVLEGGASVCSEAGIPVAGGHSIDSVEPIYGLVALGLVHPDKVLANRSARAGDVLILTKALGVHTDLTGSAAGVYGFSQMAVGGLCTLGASLGNNPALSAFTVLTLACIVGQLGFRSALRVKTA